MSKRKPVTTKLEIIQKSAELFFEKGYSNVSPNLIAKELNMSTGNLTYYFPTKEHLLAVLVNELCSFQRKLIEDEAEEGISPVSAVCLELVSMASACESNPIAKDFLISSYQSPLTLKIIRENDCNRSKKVFSEYCKDWTVEQFSEAEILVSGIEYGTLVSLDDNVSLRMRIAGALDKILFIYGVPEALRKEEIHSALGFDYKNIGERIFREFVEYVNKFNEEAFYVQGE